MHCLGVRFAATLAVALVITGSQAEELTSFTRLCNVTVTTTITTTIRGVPTTPSNSFADLEENPVPQIPGRGFLQLEHRTSQEMPRLECSASSSALCSAEGTPEIPSATETAPGPDRVGKGPRRLRLSKGAIAGIAIGGGVGLGLILAPVFYFRNCSRRLSRTRMRMRMRKRGRDDGEETPSPSIKPEADSTQDIQLAVPAPLRPSRSPPAPSPASQSSRVPIGGPSKKSLTRRQHRPRTPSPLVPPPLAKAAISGGNRDKELPALPLEHHDDRRLTLPSNKASRNLMTSEARGGQGGRWHQQDAGLNYPHQQVQRSAVELPVEGAEKSRFPTFSRASAMSDLSDFSWFGQADESDVPTPASRRA